jgi:hypothetical protein
VKWKSYRPDRQKVTPEVLAGSVRVMISKTGPSALREDGGLMDDE